MIVQHNIRDIDNELITPWDAYDKLRHGTVVLIQASLLIWVMKDSDASPEKKVSISVITSWDSSTNSELQFYQLAAESVRVIAESPEVPEIRTVPVLRSKPTTTGTASPTKLATQAFESFQSPSKKARAIWLPVSQIVIFNEGLFLGDQLTILSPVLFLCSHINVYTL